MLEFKNRVYSHVVEVVDVLMWTGPAKLTRLMHTFGKLRSGKTLLKYEGIEYNLSFDNT